MLVAVLALPACTGGGAGGAQPPAPAAASGPVAVPAPTGGTRAVRQACTALLASLPAEIGEGLRRRDVEGDPARAAAWGEPPVTLECGVGRPERDEPPIELGPNDEGPLVAFTVRDAGAANRFTTSRTTPVVAVTVPDVYDSQVLQSLAPALRTVQRATPAPSPAG